MLKKRVKKLAWNSAFKKLRSWHLVPQFMENRREKLKAVTDFLFLGSKILKMVISTMKLKDACSLEEKL